MNLRRFSFLLIPACAAWLGCAGGEPGTSPELDNGQSPVNTDNTPPVGDGTWMGEELAEGCAPDGGTPPGDTVFVKRSTRYITAAGVTEVPYDMSASPPEVLVPNGVTFTRITGTAVDGGYQFAGVPSGPYYLRSGTSTYVLTDERQVDLSSSRLGRPDAVLTGWNTTPVQVNLVNLSPWAPWMGTSQPGSSLQVVSRQLDLYGGVDIYDIDPTGQTHILSTGAELWSGIGPIPIFEADKGDRLMVNQLSPMDAGTLPDGGALAYSTVVRSVEMGAFDFKADGTTPMPINGVMQPVPMGEFPLEWRLPQYTARATEVHPAATPSLPYFYVTPAAHGLQHGWVSYSGELLTLQLPRASSYDFTRRLTYGNPFPPSWSLVGSASYSFRSLQTIPDGSGSTFYVTGSFGTYDRLENLVAGPIQPRVSSPRELRIDGVPASVARQVGSASPLITWTPPTLGSPSAYQVSIYRVTNDDGFPFSTLYRRFYMSGSTTQVRLPPGVLESGGIYFLRVAAVVAPSYDVERQPFTYAEVMPFAHADAVSSLITTP